MPVPRRPFGRTGVEVPVIGQGTWQLRDARAAASALATGLDLGLSHIDTAELYRGSEEAIAPVVRGRREEVFLVSKVLPRNASYEGTIARCEASLNRLGVERLDVYLLHWRTDDHPLRDSLRALEDLVDKGRTRFLGVSNFDVADLEEAESLLGRHRIACNQVLYHLDERGIESELIPYCRDRGIAVVGYSPFGSGKFPAPGSRRRKALDAVAARHGATARQVALSFLTRLPGTFAIPKSENPAHTRENAGAADVVLGERDLEEIEAAFPRPPPGPLGML